ncbi:two-component sensor histidine kinase [Brevundimonas faecalis]|uniref:histidine kinase n=2 Tax=Brevundimonas faecalis TaxID=947378 RepID=A0ABV2RFL7_9CAUL
MSYAFRKTAGIEEASWKAPEPMDAADRHHEMLTGEELNHRIKNIFAVVSALVALTARTRPEAKEFSRDLRGRIGALAQAHAFVRPRGQGTDGEEGQTLQAFLRSLFSAYAAGGEARVRVAGDDAGFDDQAATSLALLFHELAVNAAEHGALSVEGGRVELDIRRRGERLLLVWRELGGPAAVAPQHQGFGASLAVMSVEGQLGGRLEQEWAETGLIVRIDLPATALSRRDEALKSTKTQASGVDPSPEQGGGQ